MKTMQLQPLSRIKLENRPDFRTLKSFSNRTPSSQLPPYSSQALKAKQKAFERYKKIYPVNDKENLYPPSKTPHLGYYLMKGYRQGTNYAKEEQSQLLQESTHSQKIITHMLKRYLFRKSMAAMKQQERIGEFGGVWRGEPRQTRVRVATE